MFCWEVGGGGRAKGFGGPDTPAERRAEADGEGGGRTIPLWAPRSGFAERLSEAPLGEPEPDSFSSDSDGIWRLSLGREEPDLDPLVSLRFGAGKSCGAEVVVVARAGCDVEPRDSWDDGCDTARGGGFISGGDCLLSSRFGGGSVPKKTRASMEPPSSIGVKMLCDFEAECLRSGGEGGLNECCSG